MGGAALGGVAPAARAGRGQTHHFPALRTKVEAPARVSLVKGDDRYAIVTRSLELIENEFLGSIGRKKILLKPNVVLADNPLAVTHVDALRAILDFLKPHHKGQILVGEGGFHPTFDGYKAHGYLELEKSYNVKLVDLNAGPYVHRHVFGKEHNPILVRINSLCLDPEVYIISAARMKTHNFALVTLTLKNLLIGAPIKDEKSNDKGLFHTGDTAVNDILHYNMFHLAQEAWPDLAVIDGFEAMEGNGPAWGTPFSSKVALAGRDALAVDTLATQVMGFDPKRVLYLKAMNEFGMGQGDLDKIRVEGTPLDQCRYKLKPHEKMAELYKLT
jgi:uncharacterized protein (DUF362 family)